MSYISCFYTNICSSSRTYYNDCPFTILIESLKFRNSNSIIVATPGNLFWKMWIWVCCCDFFQKWPCKAWLKITLPKNKSIQKLKRHWSMRQHENWQKRKCKVYRYKLHHKLQLLTRICFLLDYLLLFLRFVLLTLSMCLFAGKNLEQNPSLFLS